MMEQRYPGPLPWIVLQRNSRGAAQERTRTDTAGESMASKQCLFMVETSRLHIDDDERVCSTGWLVMAAAASSS